jgi:hypothetical protein
MGAREEDGVALEKVTALFKTEKEKGWDEWEVLEMDVQEEIGQPTHGQLVIAATSQNFDFSPMLGKSCVLVLSRGYDRKRFFKGLVFRIEHRGEYPFGSVAKIDFATAVRALQHGQDSRVFENQTVPQILEEVFKEALEPFGREVRLNLSRTYPVREYCTQYKESDWNFVQRLMADEGITFYLDEGGKEADRETVVLVDCNDSFPEIETMGSVEEPVESLKDLGETKTSFRAKIVDDATGRPISQGKIDVRLVDGSTRSLVSGGNGSVEALDVLAGNHTLSGALAGATVRNVLEVVAVGESASAGGEAPCGTASKGPGRTTHRKNAGESAGPPSYDLIALERYRVKTGDTLEKIAARHELGRAALAHFNWGVHSAEEVDEKLRDEVGCTEKDANGRYVLTDEAEPGLIFIPKPWNQSGLQAGKQHTIRVRAPEQALPDLKLQLEYDPEDPPAGRLKGGALILETEDGSWTHELPIGALSEVQPHVLAASFPPPPIGLRLSLFLDLNDGRERVDVFVDANGGVEERLELVPRLFPARLLRGKKTLRVRAMVGLGELHLPPQKSVEAITYEEPIRVSEPIASLKLLPESVLFPAQTSGGGFPVFEVGPPVHPEINHDHGFLDNHADRADHAHPGKCNLDNSKRREPTWADRRKLAKWRTKLLMLEAAHRTPAGLVPQSQAEDARRARQWRDAIPAYRHFHFGEGKPRAVDYEDFLEARDDGETKGDQSGATILSSAIEDTRAAAIELDEKQYPGSVAPRVFEIRSQVITVRDGDSRYPYPVTENWQKAIGGHPIWITAIVDVSPDPGASVRRFSIFMTIHMEDMYNFNPGAHDKATGIADAENGLFEITGLAHEFLNVGEACWELSFSVPLRSVLDRRARPPDEVIAPRGTR